MLKNTFCSSPWYHFRIENNGDFDFCRWSTTFKSNLNIKTTSLVEFFNSEYMNQIRFNFLAGEENKNCHACYYQNKKEINKISGRERQLLKSGIMLRHFDNSFVNSPHFDYFDFSYKNHGKTKSFIADLQINLGTFCNSECIMCSPKYSSKLDNTFKLLGWINPKNKLYQGEFSSEKSWVDNDQILNNFVTDLAKLQELKYIHIIGGEPLIIPAFYKLCKALVEADISKNITLGVTTNCTVWDPLLIKLLTKFKEVHIGLSIESPLSLNDYIRYPSKISEVMNVINKFIELRNNTNNIILMLRPSPNVLSIWHYDKLMEFGLETDIHLETCNILYRPEWLQIKVLPINLRFKVAEKIAAILNKFNDNTEYNPNQRSRYLVKDNIINDAKAYQRELLSTEEVSDNLKFNLVLFLKELEAIRKNNILIELPEYEKFLRRYNY